MDIEDQVSQFVRESKAILKPYLNEYGLVLYSHRSTLRRNPVLFYGINPGCDPSISHPIRWTIEESLDYFQNGFKILEDGDRQESIRDLINHQSWPTPNFATDYAKGQAPYQRRTRCLLQKIGYPDALVTNLFFRQTRDAQALRNIMVDGFAEACWRVHELIFQITEPKAIITCGDAVRAMFRRKLGLESVPGEEIPAGHDTWKCRCWRGYRDGQRVFLIEIPHLSRYDIAGARRRPVLEWVGKLVGECVATEDMPEQQ